MNLLRHELCTGYTIEQYSKYSNNFDIYNKSETLKLESKKIWILSSVIKKNLICSVFFSHSSTMSSMFNMTAELYHGNFVFIGFSLWHCALFPIFKWDEEKKENEKWEGNRPLSTVFDLFELHTKKTSQANHVVNIEQQRGVFIVFFPFLLYTNLWKNARTWIGHGHWTAVVSCCLRIFCSHKLPVLWWNFKIIVFKRRKKCAKKKHNKKKIQWTRQSTKQTKLSNVRKLLKTFSRHNRQ